MSFENYTAIYREDTDGQTLRPGGSPMKLCFPGKGKDKALRLFVVGETALFYLWKDEPDMPAHYRTITDALDTKNAWRAHYCLNLSSRRPEGYVRRLYKKVMWPPVLSYLGMHPVPEDWSFGISLRGEEVSIAADGFLRMRLEVRYLHEGVNRHSVALPPDETHVIDFPAGSYDWHTVVRQIRIPPEKTAHVGVWIEGKGYEGRFYLEKPFLTAASGENLLPDFDLPVPDKAFFDWTAQYLSRKEWPEFEVTLNGVPIFSGEIFERCHRDSEWELALPGALIREQNELTLRLISDYHEPVPYVVHEVGLIEQPGAALSLLACSPVGTLEDGAHILLKTDRPGMRVRFVSEDGSLKGDAEYLFNEAGLHGIHLDCPRVCGKTAFRLLAEEGVEATGYIDHVVDRPADHVVTGTGDMIYIEQREDAVEEYLSWYIANGIGNLLTIRPTYRWSGTRLLNPAVWKLVTRVLQEMGIRYVLMLDGRELPGISANPDDAMLAGTGYCGRQNHERDGAQFYWGIKRYAEQFDDMEQQAWKEDPAHTNPAHAPVNYLYNGEEITLYRAAVTPHDNKEGAAYAVRRLAEARGGAPRHTGPSVMFKYLMQAGYDWVGAETMYGSMEPLMAFLRGARYMAGRTDLGVHHAVQWSSSPEDAPEHFRRYRLALYVSYMQGATEINTEEGLWHLEEYYSHFHRFSEGCGGHRRQQQDFYRYVASHSRTGRFVTPMALLHGRYDGWHAFGNQQPWGWVGVPLSDAEKSWDLLRVFYPESRPGEALYIHGCDTDHAVGYHTGMPMGNVDILPAESREELFKGYKALAFMGYHCFEAEDREKLEAYVEKGGTLLLTRAHLTETTAFEEISTGRLRESPKAPFSLGSPEYVENHVDGTAVMVCRNLPAPDSVAALTDEGLPLAVVYRRGRGKITLVNAAAYPAHPAIRPLYEKLLGETMRGLADAETVWTETGSDVGSAVYQLPDGTRHIYFLAVDWFRPEEKVRKATLRVGKERYTVSMPFGVLIKCVVKDGFALWPHSEQAEVCRIENGQALVQGTGKVTFTLAHDGKEKQVTVDFEKDGEKLLTF